MFSTSNEVTVAYSKIISNSSSVSSHPNIRCHIIWAIESVVKYNTDMQESNLKNGTILIGNIKCVRVQKLGKVVNGIR
jgi:hypothetical protein